MQNGDFVRLAYTGKIKETGQIFDKAEDAPVIVGGGYLLPAIDSHLESLTIGHKKSVEIAPNDAFGQRDSKLIKIVPEAEFKKRDVHPVPGMPIEADDMRGRVTAVTSGRVTLDFNHPLAGKVLAFDLEVKSKIENMDDKIKAVAEFYCRTPADKLKCKADGKEVELELPPAIHSVFKKKIADDLIKWLGFTKVKFVEIFEKQKESKEL